MADAPQVVILAAGLGTRMRSTRPKVLHHLLGVPLLDHVLALASSVSTEPPHVVINPSHHEVEDHLRGRAQVKHQAVPRGSGDALRSISERARGTGPVVVLSGDVPLLRPETLRGLLAAHQRGSASCTLLTALPDAEFPLRGLGRVVRAADGTVARIVEERDLSPADGDPKERNVGVYVFQGARLWAALDLLTTDNAQGELYLTQLISLMPGPIDAVELADTSECLGINDRSQLAAAESVLRHRVLDGLMEAGVTIIDPATTYVDAGVSVGQDSVIRPMTCLLGRTRLGRGCDIGPMAQLLHVEAGDRLKVGASVLEECQLGDDVTIGHFDRVRPGTSLAAGVSLGTHAEVKNSSIGEGTRINHFACILDSDVGRRVNIGAGSVTCNFDGEAKHRTRIADGVFVGTNTTLVAPVEIAEGAYIAAGSLVNGNVPAGALAVGRARQRNIDGWARRRRGQREEVRQ